MNEVKRYMTAIERGLHMDRKTRARVMNDLSSDFQNRRDAGQTDAEIMAELGTPAQAAAELNAAFAAEKPAADRSWGVPSRWRWLFLALAVLALLAWALTRGSLPVARGSADALGVIGGADGPTVIFVTQTPVMAVMAGPWAFLAALCGFLLLGWCRADRRRLWLPIALCGVPLAALAVRAVGILLVLPQDEEARQAVLRSLAASATTVGAALLAAVLVWAVWLYRRSKRR